MIRFTLIAALSLPLFLPAQDRPLAALPYTPTLDPAFLDRSVDPCTDFYKFACGNWIKLNPIPADQASWDVYGKLETDNLRYLWGLLQEAAKPVSTRTPNQQKIGDYFASCMDEASIEKAGAAPLRPQVNEIAALDRLANLPVLLAHLHLASTGESDPLFVFTSSQDYADSSREIAFAMAGGLGLPDRDYYVKTDAKSQETRAHYVDHVARTFQFLGDSPALAKSEAQTVMDIETALAKASLTRVEKRDPYKLFHKMTTADLSRLTPSFNWNAYWTALGLPPQTEINVTEPKFFVEVGHQLQTRSLADWKAYLRWHLAHEESRYLSPVFVRADFDFYSRYLRGVSEIQPRWKRCVRFIDRDLGEALGQVFVDKTFSPETKTRALAMTREIEKMMQNDLEHLAWMGPATRAQAIAKLHAIVNKIGYPDKWRDYSSLSIMRGDFLGNVNRSAIFESLRQLNKIGKPVDRTEWEITAPTVNAYYDPQMNDINFPAGVLEPPLFDAHLDEAPNYGNTGATIGHELTHGFDDEGRQFDARGDLKDWWTAQDAKQFDKRAACVVNQYAQYTVVDDIKINSKLTEGEDIADLGGTILAYLAWKDATRNQALKPIGSFTPDQRFFIGMAQWACGDERPEEKRLNATINPHSPLQYRVNGVVSNMPEFQRAFSCKPVKPMVRAQACRVW
jgi:putative endopeptidase